MDFVVANSRDIPILYSYRISDYGIKTTLPSSEITAVGRGRYPQHHNSGNPLPFPPI